MRHFLKLIKNRGGFTMQELMVAVSLFIIVMALASGAFVQGIRAQRDVVSSTSTNSNITQAIERMAREIRTGHTFADPTDPTNSSVLSFTNFRAEKVKYTRNAVSNSIERCVVVSGSCVYAPITAGKVFVSYMNFYFIPDELASGGGSIPRITVAVGVKGIKNSIVNFQTTVASRVVGL